MMNFIFGKYIGKYVMNCKTEDEIISFREAMYENGYKQFLGISYLLEDDCWERYKENSCYDFNKGMHGSKELFIERGYTVLEWSDFKNDYKMFVKSDFKNGDVILKRNGNVEIVLVDTGTLIVECGFNSMNEVNEDLTSSLNAKYDIIKVRRPNEDKDCQFCAFAAELGELVYARVEDNEVAIGS